MTLEFNFPIRCVSKDNEKVFGKYHHQPFTSKKYKDFEKAIQLLARQQYKGEPLTGDLAVRMIFYFIHPKVRCDIFNLPKSVGDSLQGIAYLNDKQIIRGELSILEAQQDGFYVEVSQIAKVAE